MAKIIAVPVETVSVKDGELTFTLCSTLANDDWIRAARYKKTNKRKYESMENERMVELVEITEKE